MERDIETISEEAKALPYDIEARRMHNIRCLAMEIVMNIRTIEKLSNRIMEYVSQMTSARQEFQIKPKMEILNVSRMMENKLNETIAAIETLSELAGKDVKEMGKLGIRYDGMKFMRRNLLPEIVGLVDSYHGAKEKMDASLAETIAKMKKVVNMIVNGEAVPPDEI